MPSPEVFSIYFDSIQEGNWFAALNPHIAHAQLLPFPGRNGRGTPLAGVLEFDRPDIVLCSDGVPILVLERTVEVPSGHNVGQRFARLAAAARAGVPSIYLFPYAGRKHGGITSGPRYMNLRLGYALDRVMEIEKSAITMICWPVDDDYEVVRGPAKDERLREYLQMFFDLRGRAGPINRAIITSAFETRQLSEREAFIREEIAGRDAQYGGPPPSVEFASARARGYNIRLPGDVEDAVFYTIGMRNIRSDPYTGMSLLYAYLYCGGLERRIRPLILRFPEIDSADWIAAARGRGTTSKTIRLYRLAADAIEFRDGFLPRDDL